MDLKLKGLNTVILGGTRGIGRSIAELMAQEGSNIAICARNADQVKETELALAKLGVKAVGGVADIADHKRLAQWVAEAGAALGGIDILISNASAIAQGNGAGAWNANFNVDMMGAVTAFEAARPLLEASAKRRGDAAAVFVSSVSAAETQNAQAYGAIKAALIHFAKGLARAHAKDRIRVNAVSPGTIYFKGGSWGIVEQNAPDFFKSMVARNPMGRMGTPEEVAAAVAFLASPVSSFTTGSNLVVDGAITGRINF